MVSHVHDDENEAVSGELPCAEPTPIYDELAAAVVGFEEELPTANLR
jgi:hypothetical protein